ALVVDPLDGSVWVGTGAELKRYGLDSRLLKSLTLNGHPSERINHLAFYADAFPPKINVTAPKANSYTNNNKPSIGLSYSDIGSGVDTHTIRVLANEQQLDIDCDAKDDEAHCTPKAALPDGKTGIKATVKDYASNVSEPAKVIFTVDTVPPTITVTQPQNDAYTNKPQLTIAGSLSETASLMVDGAPVIPNLNLSFSYTIKLTEGVNKFELTATDLADNAASISRTITLDTTPPPPPSLNLISVSGPDSSGKVTVTGKPGTVEPGDTVTLANTRTGQSVTVTSGADGSFTATIAAQASDKLAITAIDKAGNATPAPQRLELMSFLVYGVS
ncbi:MAG TPA: Ig-like domain-containing protein, partial [Candidatus Saccharimonadales bacterium]|nr:Ig-like domain-containing protein [Candidatus Saccharimonadales bacterium]